MNPALPDNTPSDNQSVLTQIDSFIAGLNLPSDTTVATAVVTRTGTDNKDAESTVFVPKTNEEMQEFILKNSAQLAALSIKSVESLQKVVTATGDPEMMASLASLITAGSGAIETVNKINIQNKKIEAAKELKKIDIESKIELQKLKNDGFLNLPTGNTNILIATREEIMNQLTGKVKNIVTNTSEVIELSASQMS